jgi:hypothetical protein
MKPAVPIQRGKIVKLRYTQILWKGGLSTAERAASPVAM